MPSDPRTAVPRPPAPGQRRRRLWITAIATVFALVVTVGVFTAFGPQLVARQVAQTYLSGLNIDTSGVQTLRIRPLQGYLSFGPVTFRGADATKGQVGRIGVRIAVPRLLRRQALVQSIAIEGVRFEVRQAADGSLSLNGIALSELLADAAASRPPAGDGPAQPTAPSRPITPRTLEEELGWGAGLDQLEIIDSRVAFIDARGGEAVMHVHQLELGGFRTWKPDRPGFYRLDSELNDIRITASGTARPFAEKIDFEAEAAVTGIEVIKLERYLGSLGFTSRAGRVNLAISDARIAVFTAGLVEGQLAATGTLTGLNLAHPLFGSGQLAAGTLALSNIAGTYDALGESTVSGDLDIDLQASELRLDNGTEVGFSRVTFSLPGTIVRTAPDQQPAVKVAPQLDIANLRLGGPDIHGSVGETAIRLSGFSIEGTEPGAPFIATGSLAIERLHLLLPKAEPIAIVADRAQATLTETRVAFPPGRGPKVEGGLNLDTHTLRIAIEPPANGGLAPLPATRIAADRIAFVMPALIYDDDGATGMNLAARGPLLSLDGLRMDGPDMEGSVGRATFALSSFGMRGTGPETPLVATGSVAVDNLDIRLADVEPVAIATRAFRAQLAETHFAVGSGGPRVTGGLDVDTQDLAISIQQQGAPGRPPPPPTTVDAARVAFNLPKVTVHEGEAAAPRVSSARSALILDRMRLGGPDIQGTIGNAVIRLASVDVDAEKAGAPFVANGSVQARGLDLLIPDVEPIGIIADDLDLRLIRTRFAFPSGRVLIDGGVVLDTRELMVSIYTQPRAGQPPLPPLRISAARFSGDLPKLVVDDSRATGTKVNVATPELILDRFRLDAPTAAEASVQVAASTLALRGVNVDVVDAETLEVSGRANVSAPDLVLTLPSADGGRGAMPTARIGGLGLDLRRFSYREAADTSGFGMRGRISLASLQGGLPPGSGGDGTVDVSGLTLAFDDLDVEMGTQRPQWRARLDLDFATLAASLRSPLALNAEISAVSLSRFSGSSPATYTFDELTVGGFAASLIRERASEPAVAATTPDLPAAEPSADAGRRPWPPPDLPVVRIGRFALVNGGRVTLLDETVTPPIVATVELETLNVENLDTTRADARTELRVNARLGEGTIRVDGWAEAFRSRPNGELQARLDALPLPTLSPYFAPQIGLDIFKGELTLGADARVADGHLDGRVRARLVGVRANDRPEAGTDRISRSVGLPLSTMLSLLEDRNGAIDITLPVSGDVMSPEFAASDVIWQILPRVLRALVTSPVRFISAAAALLAAGDSGGGDVTTPSAPLPPLLFAPGDAALTAEALAALSGLQEVLKAHPQRSLTVCGHAAAEDYAVLAVSPSQRRGKVGDDDHALLTELATARTLAVREMLTAAGGIEAARVHACVTPGVNKTDLAPPRAVFHLVD